jgi:hypothetical protein
MKRKLKVIFAERNIWQREFVKLTKSMEGEKNVICKYWT